LGFADGGEDGVLAEDDGDLVVEVAEAGFGVVFGGGVALELLLAEFEFGFLDGGHAFADGGIPVAAEHGGDFVEGVHVFVHGGTGEGELEREFFKDFDGAGGEVRFAVGGEFEDLQGDFVIFGALVEELGRSSALDEALEGGFVDGDVEFLGGALGGLAVAEVFDEGAELLELAAVEGFEATNIWFHKLIADCG